MKQKVDVGRFILYAHHLSWLWVWVVNQSTPSLPREEWNRVWLTFLYMLCLSLKTSSKSIGPTSPKKVKRVADADAATIPRIYQTFASSSPGPLWTVGPVRARHNWRKIRIIFLEFRLQQKGRWSQNDNGYNNPIKKIDTCPLIIPDSEVSLPLRIRIHVKYSQLPVKKNYV